MRRQCPRGCHTCYLCRDARATLARRDAQGPYGRETRPRDARASEKKGKKHPFTKGTSILKASAPLKTPKKNLGDLPLTPSFQQRPRRVLGPPRVGDDAGKCHLADFPPADASNFYYISLANPSCPWIIHLRVACIGNADLLGAEWKEKGGPNTGAGGPGRERQSAMCADMFD